MMEKTLVLLLLLCSFSLAHKDSSEEEIDDIHAVLRDMSAALAEHKVKIEQLQTINQEQAAKLEELEKETTEGKEQLQEQAAKLEELEKETALGGQVAFSASLWTSGEKTLGPFNAHTTLVFKYVVSNIGNAYSPKTGEFTAPVRGAYHFEFFFGAFESSWGTAAVLVKNGEHVVAAWEHQTNGFGTAANGATLLLEAGDVVLLRLWQTKVIFDNGNHHSTFNGHLLFTM